MGVCCYVLLLRLLTVAYSLALIFRTKLES